MCVCHSCDADGTEISSSDGGNSGTKRCERGGSYGGGLAESAFRESLESEGRFYIGAFGWNPDSVRREHVVTFNLHFIKIFFYKFCIFMRP
jgi:hypothetical protein